MAIKIFDVPGEKILDDEKQAQTQDILLVDYPVFVVKSAKDYIDLFLEIERTQSRNPLGFFFPSLNPGRWRWVELGIGIAYRLKTVPSLLTTQYWSMTPYRLGERAVKLMARPSPRNRQGRFWSHLGPRQPNYLRADLAEHLQQQSAVFDLFVQFQTDPVRMPIENPIVRWPSAFHKVATLHIPPQPFDQPEQRAFCEHLSFTPWHTLPEHRPLGGINRTRKRVYETISRLRNRLNGVAHQEPTIAAFKSLFPLNGDD
jgi:hypothetical protein